ncbi:MAG: OB-fold putative lipoprotein [Vicinamibacteria bacterium]|nr:OB-fold putative lipoprotein [Vicinamibacteria bacterium]
MGMTCRVHQWFRASALALVLVPPGALAAADSTWLSADALHAEFEKDPAATEAKYAGQRVVVSGRFNPTFPKTQFSIVGEQGLKFVNCEDAPAPLLAAKARIAEGAPVEVAGTLRFRTLGTLHFFDLQGCTLEKGDSAVAPAVAPAVATTAVPTPKACELVTLEELRANVGADVQPVGARAPDGTDDDRGCQWKAGNAAFELYLVEDAANVPSRFEAMKRSPGTVPLSGIGDDAFWVAGPRLLQARVGPFLMISGGWAEGMPGIMAAQTTAQAAVTRLQGVLARRAGQPWLDACTLLTQAEVDTALGRAARAGSLSAAPVAGTACSFALTAADASPLEQFAAASVTAYPLQDGLFPSVKNWGAMLEAAAVAEMPGALFSDAAGSAQLAFEKGGFLVVIGTAAPDAAKARLQAIALAKRAAPRVP